MTITLKEVIEIMDTVTLDINQVEQLLRSADPDTKEMASELWRSAYKFKVHLRKLREHQGKLDQLITDKLA